MIFHRHLRRLFETRTVFPSAQTTDARHVFDEARKRAPEFRDLQRIQLMRSQPRQAVFRVAQSGRQLYVKHLRHPRGPQMVRQMAEELDYVSACLDDERYGVCHHVASAPEAGLIALSAVPGRLLADAIGAADSARRGALLRKSGDWLRSYCALRQRHGRFQADRMLIRFPQKVQIGNSHDLARWRQLMDWQTAQRDRLEGQPITVAAIHGDFHPNNAHVDGAKIHAFDISGNTWLPAARDCAKFLTQQQLMNPDFRGPSRCGLAAADYDNFLSSGVLSDDEIRKFLPLFIAGAMTRVLVEKMQPPRRLHRLRRMIDMFLHEQAGTGR